MIGAPLSYKETRKMFLKKNHSILGFLYPSHGVDHELRKETEKKVKQNSIRKEN